MPKRYGCWGVCADVTVQGAGHMVPTYKPGFALALFTKFINNEEF